MVARRTRGPVNHHRRPSLDGVEEGGGVVGVVVEVGGDADGVAAERHRDLPFAQALGEREKEPFFGLDRFGGVTEP